MTKDITRYFSKRKRISISDAKNEGENDYMSIASTSVSVTQGAASVPEVMDATHPPDSNVLCGDTNRNFFLASNVSTDFAIWVTLG